MIEPVYKTKTIINFKQNWQCNFSHRGENILRNDEEKETSLLMWIVVLRMVESILLLKQGVYPRIFKISDQFGLGAAVLPLFCRRNGFINHCIKLYHIYRFGQVSL
jgi:hypothetical protein